MSQELTRQTAEQAVSYQFDQLPADVVQMAQYCVLDNLGCALRGMHKPLVNILADEFLGRSLVIDDLLPNRPKQSEVADSNQALVHGAAAHAIDFDDTMVPAHAAHIGAGVVSAVLTLARRNPTLNGADIFTSIVAGYETTVRIAKLLHSDHYQNGFHSTSSIGMFGVAAACSNLLGLSVEQTQMALGLAATQAAGIKCTFGTMSKPFNAGNTASSGLLAAKLAAGGFTAPTASLEGHNGYLKLFEGLPPESRKVEGTNHYCILQNNFKFHAACLWTHPAIDGIVEMREEFNFEAQDVEKLTICVHPILLESANVGVPRSGLDCKFSFSQIGAYALAGYDTAADQTFSNEILSDELINGLRQKVRTTVDPELTLYMARLRANHRDGRVFETLFDSSSNVNYVNEVSGRLIQKFLINATPRLGSDGAEKLKEFVLKWAN